MNEQDQIQALLREVEWLRSHVDVLTKALADAQQPKAMRIVSEPREPREPGPPLPSVLRSRIRPDRPTENDFRDLRDAVSKASAPAIDPNEPKA